MSNVTASTQTIDKVINADVNKFDPLLMQALQDIATNWSIHLSGEYRKKNTAINGQKYRGGFSFHP